MRHFSSFISRVGRKTHIPSAPQPQPSPSDSPTPATANQQKGSDRPRTLAPQKIPFLPNELKWKILRHCDTDTLFSTLQVSSAFRSESERILEIRGREAAAIFKTILWTDEPTPENAENAEKLRIAVPFFSPEGIQLCLEEIDFHVSMHMEAGVFTGVLWGHAHLNKRQREHLLNLVRHALLPDARYEQTRPPPRSNLMMFILASIHQPEKPQLYQPFLDMIQPRSPVERLSGRDPQCIVTTAAVERCIPGTQMPSSVRAQLDEKFEQNKFRRPRDF